MALNQDYLGKVYPASPAYQVGREKIREFAIAIGDMNPAYHDVAAARALGHRDVDRPADVRVHSSRCAPARSRCSTRVSASTTAGSSTASSASPTPAPSPPATSSSCVTTIENIRVAAGNDILTTRARHHAPSTASPSSRPGRSPSPAAPQGSPHERVRRLGRRRGRHRAPAADACTLQRVNLVMYAGASGDFNPIHWNERFAQAVGLPDVIAHGMLTMASAGRVVTDWVGDPGAVVEYGVRFTRPVVVPDDDRGATRRDHRGRWPRSATTASCASTSPRVRRRQPCSARPRPSSACA